MLKNGLLTCSVKADSHCNLDSLPLRFGFMFDEDSIIVIKVFSFTKSKKIANRTIFEGEICPPDSDETIFGSFVVADPDQEKPILISAWRHDANEEYYLSEVIRRLRESAFITSSWLLNKHPLYINGDLRTHSDLLTLLARKLSQTEIDTIQDEAAKVISELKVQLDDAEARADKAEKRARFLESENKKMEAEASTAKRSSSMVYTTPNDLLVSVDLDVSKGPSSCTVLNMGDGTQWYMKTATFDRDLSITRKAKALEGKRVRVTSWDPINEPGKWSSQHYFRNIYLAE